MVSPSAVQEDVRFIIEYLRKKGYQATAETEGENLCGRQDVDTTHSTTTPTHTTHTAHTHTTLTAEMKETGYPFFNRPNPHKVSRNPPPPPVSATASVPVTVSGGCMCVWGTRMNEIELMPTASV